MPEEPFLNAIVAADWKLDDACDDDVGRDSLDLLGGCHAGGDLISFADNAAFSAADDESGCQSSKSL